MWISLSDRAVGNPVMTVCFALSCSSPGVTNAGRVPFVFDFLLTPSFPEGVIPAPWRTSIHGSIHPMYKWQSGLEYDVRRLPDITAAVPTNSM